MANLALDLGPGLAGLRILLLRFDPPLEFLQLPVRNRDTFRMLGHAFPQCRDDIEFFLDAEMHYLFEERCLFAFISCPG